MDRTAKEVFNLYQNSSVNRQRYMFSLALLGDVQGRSMRDLSRRFSGLRKDDPKNLSRGFQDMNLDHDDKATNGMRQTLHDIKTSGKGLSNTLEMDNLLAKHFMNVSTGGMLTSVLGGQALSRFSQKHSDEQTPDVRLKKAGDDDKKDGSSSAQHDDEQKERAQQRTARPEDTSTTASDMNQTNVRRHTEEESELDNKLARDKKKRMRAQRQMKNKGPHM